MVGSACDAPHAINPDRDDWQRGDYYVVGGSGRVVAPHAVSILAGLRAKGVGTVVSRSDSVAEALAAAGQARALLVCASSVTSENADRSSLKLDQHELLVGLSAAAASGALTVPLVVALMAPGAVAVAPWAHGASEILAMFLGGQETGNGWADVLLLSLIHI